MTVYIEKILSRSSTKEADLKDQEDCEFDGVLGCISAKSWESPAKGETFDVQGCP